VFERVVLLNSLPALDQGSRETYRIRDELIKDLSFSEEELAALEFHYPGETYVDDDGTERTVRPGEVKWKDGVVADKDVPLSGQRLLVVRRHFEALDRAERLRPPHIPLYDRIMAEKE
jgi:hypothetical protein